MVSREPEVHEVGEGGWLVRFTGDVSQAADLLHAHLVAEKQCDDLTQARTRWPATEGRFGWKRVVPALPNSWAAAEGYAFYYQDAEPGARGAFRAVEWWS